MVTSHERRARLSIDVDPELRRRIKIAAAEQDLSVRDFVERILRQAIQGDVPSGGGSAQMARSPHVDQPPMRDRLTPEEQARGRRALAELERLNEELLQQRSGRPFPSSWEMINEARDERTRQLMHDE